MDIDLFKKYNTELGYEKADLKLIELAKLFKEMEEKSRSYDCIHKLNLCHMSGDEYLVVFETIGKGVGTGGVATYLEVV